MKVAQRAAILIVLALQLVFALERAHAAESGPAFSVLLFSRTAGFRHDSIAAGIAAIGALGEQNNFRVDAVEDAKVFTDENLARYRVVIFMNTTGEVLDAGGQAAFEKFIRRVEDSSASMRRAIPDTTGRGTAAWSAPIFCATRSSSPRR